VNKPRVDIWTDGSCVCQTRIGGWGAVLVHGASGSRRELCGGTTDTTNNRMEMTAAIKALLALKSACRVRLYTDSKYLRGGFAEGWIEKWRRCRWRNSQGKPVKNKDLWLDLATLDRVHDIEWIWVKGHAGDPNNERADRLADKGRRSIS